MERLCFVRHCANCHINVDVHLFLWEPKLGYTSVAGQQPCLFAHNNSVAILANSVRMEQLSLQLASYSQGIQTD